MSRIASTFDALRREDRAAFVPFVMAGDPDYETGLDILRALPQAGADVIELGVCFTDPMADGPAIQAAGLRALSNGQTLAKTLDMVRAFRAENDDTPLILMGYCNPFASYGFDRFAADAAAAGVDGAIVVDLPPEEDAPLRTALVAAGIDLIRLVTPTTHDDRLETVLAGASGFVYYVAVAGVTGRASAAPAAVRAALARVRRYTNLPICVGFGVKTPEQAQTMAQSADGVVVGSALCEALARAAERKTAAGGLETGRGEPDTIGNAVLTLARDIATATRRARNPE
ncbi:MAG: tryptophan synthase subunit alpha [Pseudomonadota bacterium]